MARIRVGSASEVPMTSMRSYTAGGYRIVVVHLDDGFYALDAKCPHLSANLGRGKLEGHILTCPSHGSRFDVRDGSVIAWVDGMPGLVKGALSMIKGPKAATTYPVTVEGEALMVTLPD